MILALILLTATQSHPPATTIPCLRDGEVRQPLTGLPSCPRPKKKQLPARKPPRPTKAP